jgi:hypothetical protein
VGRRRNGYSREELALGIRLRLGRHASLYAEGAKAYYMLSKEWQEPWRVQGGLEYERPAAFFDRRFGWYTAVDVAAMEERDWRVDVAAQAGLVTHSRGRAIRLGVEYVDGRPPLGEFFQHTERWITFGFWVGL